MSIKAITPFGICLLATAGFAWLANTFIQPTGVNGTAPVEQASMLPSFTSKSGKLKPSSAVPKAAVNVVNAYPKLTFDAPVEYTYAQDGTNRVFVVEQAGRIRSFDNSVNATSAPVYLDIRNKVGYGGEMGLLGLAFHPKFRENGYFYVNYTKNNPRETIISRFKAASPSATTIDPATEVVLIRFNQPYANHNGGKVLFGPDGYLYISTGDGGSGGDPQNNAQNRQSWLGKVLRIDVNSTEKGHYGIPADNPFAKDAKARPEIFAYGLRNPWRISFDDKNRLWAGDVGQNELEEVDILTKGGNYGWRIEEGRQPYKEPDGKKPDNLIEPIWQYKHDDGNVSITGGTVYQGSAVPSLKGKYIYADFASGRVWALTTTDGKKVTNQEIVARAGSISAFGEDQKKELYLCDLSSGKILRLGR
ncbi:PQQ-dependent sugar dehydrogenase [Spirosoma rhododendri]|uniref:PQQ-dependent sugar dehydrogenase n=1 Tax=Spirosoma rhododendri TaxID=2728024 RepID=A0A7L5DQH3_9BACT|nr:PQQ-dependent sugar dehydrogenase [Spirosoma rhododendri]QJD80656.1 PQQ-dependent sugar dehydrogenase [Spirosoma rhododendri]